MSDYDIFFLIVVNASISDIKLETMVCIKATIVARYKKASIDIFHINYGFTPVPACPLFLLEIFSFLFGKL